jgi:pimeloyl-ACP methyl ester carboxylesterase
MRRFPESVRSVIMKGVGQIAAPFTGQMGQDAQRAWDILCDDCAADPACHAAFPKLKEEFAAVFERLDAGVKTEVHTANGQTERVKISRATIGPTIRTTLQSVDDSAELPLMVHQAFEGNYAPLAESALAIRRAFPKAVSVGLFLTLGAIENIALENAEKVAAASAGTFLRDDYFKQLRRAADILPRKELPPDASKPVEASIPTLLISGFADPATPPAGAEEVARHLSKSRHVVVRYGSHSFDGLAGCVENLMAEFIERGSAEGLDTSCVERIRRPPFLTQPKPEEAD